MSPDFTAAADWSALLDWYVEAEEPINDLDSCRVIVDSMMIGTAGSNLVIAPTLNDLTLGAELWLLSHPCPIRWNCDHLLAIVNVYRAIGELIVGVGGDPADAEEWDLQDKVVEAGRLLDEAKYIIMRLKLVLKP